jgi:hypothetical protein
MRNLQEAGAYQVQAIRKIQEKSRDADGDPTYLPDLCGPSLACRFIVDGVTGERAVVSSVTRAPESDPDLSALTDEELAQLKALQAKVRSHG